MSVNIFKMITDFLKLFNALTKYSSLFIYKFLFYFKQAGNFNLFQPKNFHSRKASTNI